MSYPKLTPIIANGATEPRYLEDRFADITNVKDFGATGTFEQDDSSAIQAAINKAAENTSSGNVVYIPEGRYLINTTIIIPSQVHVVGEGVNATYLIASNTLAGALIVTTDTDSLFNGNTASGAKYWSLSNCSLIGVANTSNVVDGIRTYSRAYSLENLKITYFTGNGINSKWASSAAAWEDDPADLFMETYINNVYIGYCGANGLYFNGPHDSRISNVVSGLNSRGNTGVHSGIIAGPNAGGTQFVNCHSWGDTQKYAYVSYGYNYFSNCVADDASNGLVLVLGSRFSWVGGYVFAPVFSSPPSSVDKEVKGFVLGATDYPVYEPYIDTLVFDTPKGCVDFANTPNSIGYINIVAGLQPSLQGTGTKGFNGTPPPSYSFNLLAAGYATNWCFNQNRFIAVDFFDPGSLVSNIAREGCVYYSSGLKRLRFHNGTDWMDVAYNNDYARIKALSAPPEDATWVVGMMYFDTTKNLLRVFGNDNAWHDVALAN